MAFADSIQEYNFAKTANGQNGILKVKTSGASGDSLILNGKKVKLDSEASRNWSVMSILAKATIGSSDVYLIWGGSGGSMDQDTNTQCKYLTVNPNKSYKLSVLTYCPSDKSLALTNGDITAKYSNTRPYAEQSDIGTYIFSPTLNKITITQRTKSDSYYKQKFATYTPKQIYQEAVADSCFEEDNNTINTAHMCNYGIKYCFEFENIKKPVHDQYYNILKKSCAN